MAKRSKKKTNGTIPLWDDKPAPVRRKTGSVSNADTANDGLALSDNARTVLARRYLKKDDTGKPVETPVDLFRRVARAVAEAEFAYDENADIDQFAFRFYEMMASLEFLPNSPTLMNAGRELGQLSACFVLPIEDTMDGIFESVKHTALIHKSGGGTGFSFSRLRPKEDLVHSTKGVASGPLSFMNVFDAATETVKQGGTRRGANMAIMRVDHPDILDFITAKVDLTRLNNFNISVGVTDAFMDAVKKNRQYDLVNPRTGENAGRMPARKVFDLIVEMAWRNGEPGVVFLDRVNEQNPTPGIGPIEATNPCGEQPLLPYESCNLGSINLSKMADENGAIDWEKLATTVTDAVRFLDDVIDINRYPLDAIAEITRGNRKIGLGVMGFAELLFRAKIPYDSAEALDLGEKIMAFVQEKARAASVELAKSRGVFPNFDQSVYAKKGPKLRNATVTTIAPTGSLSILAGTSSGVEPLFALGFVRHILDGDQLVELNPQFVAIASKEGFYSDELMDRVAQEGSVRGMDEVPAAWRKVLVTALDVSPEWHIRMQAAFQKHTDNAVSKTVNFAESATQKDVASVFKMAHDLNCKGVTVFRYGSRSPVLNLGKSNGKEAGGNGETALYDAIRPRARNSRLRGSTELVDVGCGKLYVTVNRDDVGICEVFTSTGRGGGCPSQSEAVSRLVSLALRCGVSVDAITHQLRGIRCHSALRRNNFKNTKGRALSCPTAIARSLAENHAPAGGKEKPLDGQDPIVPRAAELFRQAAEALERTAPREARPEVARMGMAEERERVAGGVCPDCAEPLETEGGCVVCRACGYSRCG